MSLQNGVANEPTLLRWFANVYGICVMAPTAHVEPGIVQANSAPISGLLDIGRYPHGVDDTAPSVADRAGEVARASRSPAPTSCGGSTGSC